VDEFALAQNQQPINREAALALDLISKLGKMWHPNKPIGVMSRGHIKEKHLTHHKKITQIINKN
jgi:hypothetical protein